MKHDLKFEEKKGSFNQNALIMYTPKLMLIIFNFILLLISVLAIFRGLSEMVPKKVRGLEAVTGVRYFSRICTLGGTMLFTVSMFGFWCADSESRGGLITYKILLFFIIGLEAILILYYGFDEDALSEIIKSELHDWSFGNEQSINKLDMVQTFLHCCELPNNATLPDGCCPRNITECTPDDVYNRTCSVPATKYFRVREARYTWYIAQITVPEFASVIFADMVVRKITVLRNMLQGKLP